MNTRVFRALNATLNPNVVPACEKHPRLSDAFWGCLARQYSQTIYHPGKMFSLTVMQLIDIYFHSSSYFSQREPSKWGRRAIVRTDNQFLPINTFIITYFLFLSAMAVVDHELLVYGVRKLRVVDCSIMPTLVSGNTNVPTMMISERTADLVKRMHLGRADQNRQNVAPRQRNMEYYNNLINN